jgi:hypothetical protein
MVASSTQLRQRPSAMAADSNATGDYYLKNSTPFLDESDQDTIVASLRKEADQRHASGQWGLLWLCRVASISCIVVAIRFDTKTDHRVYSIYSAIYQLCLSIVVTSNQGEQKLLQIIAIAAALLPPILLTTAVMGATSTSHTIVWSLTLVNILTLFGVILFRQDVASTKQALQDLDSSKYRYKSL